MAKATIKAAKSKFTVNENSTSADHANDFVSISGATWTKSTFNFSSALDNDAKVVVRLQGIGAKKGPTQDFDGFKWSTDGTTWTDVPANGVVQVPMGSTKLMLATQINNDTKAGEINESVLFSVAQHPSASKVLENSYYVTSAVKIKETTEFATITATNNNAEVIEGGYAQADFAVSPSLAGTAWVQVKLEGQGASLSDDTDGTFEYSTTGGNNGGIGWTTISSPRIQLQDGTTKLSLRTKVNADNVTENQLEQLNFSVAQVSGNLENSYYVLNQLTLKDPAVNTTQQVVATVAGNETLTGGNGQDLFDMTAANSRPFITTGKTEWAHHVASPPPTTTYYMFENVRDEAPYVRAIADGTPSGRAADQSARSQTWTELTTSGKNTNTVANAYDTITNFGVGDVIKLSDSVNRYNIASTTAQKLLGLASNATVSELDLLRGLNTNDTIYDSHARAGNGSILKIEMDANTVFLLIDTNANGFYETRYRGAGKANGENDKYDTLIKVVGAANLGDDLVDFINGDSFFAYE